MPSGVDNAQVQKNGRTYPLEHELNANGIRAVTQAINSGSLTVLLNGKAVDADVALLVAEKLAANLGHGGAPQSDPAPASTGRPGM